MKIDLSTVRVKNPLAAGEFPPVRRALAPAYCERGTCGPVGAGDGASFSSTPPLGWAGCPAGAAGADLSAGPLLAGADAGAGASKIERVPAGRVTSMVRPR